MSASTLFIDIVLLVCGFLIYHRWVTRGKKPVLPSPIQAKFEQELYRLAEELVAYFQASAHPEDLLRHSSWFSQSPCSQ